MGIKVEVIKKIKSLGLLKHKCLWVLFGIAALLSAVCIYKIVEPNNRYRYEGEYTFEQGIATGDTVLFERIALLPGVYYVELEYNTDMDFINSCSILDSSVFRGGLKTNGEQLHSGLDRTGFYMWLLEETEELQVCVSYEGEGSLRTSGVTFIETDQLWTCFLTVILFVFLILACCLTYYYYEKEYGVSGEKKNTFFWIMLISLIASVPYFFHGNVAGADTTYHLQRIEGIKDGLLSGQFPVRIEPEWVQGHGYANAVFYCPALLLIPALLRLAGFTVSVSFNVYCIAMNIATAWISYYCFSRIFKNKQIGIMCSALYTLSIFRTYRFLIMAVVGEGSAITFLPLIFYGLYRIFTENPKDKSYKTAWIPVAAGYAGIIQTHVLTCEITVFLTLVICFICIKKIFRPETFLELAKGALAAIGVSLWYLVPFVDYYLTQNVHIKYVSARTIQDRGLYGAQLLFNYWQFGSNVLLGENGMRLSHALGIGLVLILGLGLFAVLWFSGKLSKKGEPALKLAKASAVLGSLLLLMSLNIFPWDKIQHINGITAALVSSIQFPNRFLGWGTVCLVAVCGYCLLLFRERGQKYCYYAGMLVVLLGVTTSGMYLIDHVIRDQPQVSIYNEEGMGTGNISGAEYLIEGTNPELLTFKNATAGSWVTVLAYEKKYLHVRLTCINELDADSYVELPMLYYKGYRAYEKESGRNLNVCAGDNNVVRVMLPPGFSGEIEVDFVSPLYWRISELISLAVVVSFISISVCKSKKRRGPVNEIEEQ